MRRGRLARIGIETAPSTTIKSHTLVRQAIEAIYIQNCMENLTRRRTSITKRTTITAKIRTKIIMLKISMGRENSTTPKRNGLIPGTNTLNRETTGKERGQVTGIIPITIQRITREIFISIDEVSGEGNKIKGLSLC